MQLGSDPIDRLAIPDGTTVEEHDLVTDGNVIVGGQSTVEFGVRGDSVIAGERVRFEGHIEAESDCRLDMWCTVADNVLVGENAYLGERVRVDGELKVAGDLDIGDDVDIEDGFEANGWIVIRNPMPTIVFLFVYLSHLLRIGEEEAAEDVVSAVAGGGSEHDPLLVPRGASVSDDLWRVSTPATIGDDCRIHGNLRAETVRVGRDGVLFGSLRARQDVTIGRGTEIKGDVTTRNGDVEVGPGVTVWGDVVAEDVALHENATVDGTIEAHGQVQMHTEPVLEDPDETAAAMADMAEEMTGERDDAPAEAASTTADESEEETSDRADASDAAASDEAAADPPDEPAESDEADTTGADDEPTKTDGADTTGADGQPTETDEADTTLDDDESTPDHVDDGEAAADGEDLETPEASD